MVSGKPCPKPQPLNPKPQTLSPKPEALNLKARHNPLLTLNLIGAPASSIAERAEPFNAELWGGDGEQGSFVGFKGSGLGFGALG